MSNKRIVNGLDTITRIEKTWNEIVEKGQYPTVVEFARKAAISSTTLYHLYSDYAEKVRKRRDRKYGKKKRSPVTHSKVPSRSLEEALIQIDELQKVLISNTNENTILSKEIEKLRKKLTSCKMQSKKTKDGED